MERHSQAESNRNQATNGRAEERPDSIHAVHAGDLRAALMGENNSHVVERADGLVDVSDAGVYFTSTRRWFRNEKGR